MIWLNLLSFETIKSKKTIPKKRLDLLLVEKGLAESRNQAQALIRSGVVLVNNQPSDKPGNQISEGAEIRLKKAIDQFVSRGGNKLQAALEAFNIVPTGWVCADFGASTGGFTDCLLQAGAAKVYAIDVGYGQLAWKLRQDPRVVVMERTNARHLTALPEGINCVVADLSFISVTKVLPAMIRVAQEEAEAILLIKPQFEVGPGGTDGGRVRDLKLRSEAIERCIEVCRDAGCELLGQIESPVPGAKKGNIEELIHLRFPSSSSIPVENNSAPS